MEQRRAFLYSLIGLSETELIRRMGVPTRTIDSDGRRFLAYDERYSRSIPGWTSYDWGYPGWGWGTFPPEVIERGCATTFELAAGRVVSVSQRGNGCY